MSAPAGLALHSIEVRYGRAVAVSDVSMTVPPGKVTALIGPNGAGKSSLVLAAFGSIRARGRVSLDGADLTRAAASRRGRAGVAVVPQGRQLFPKLTVRDNLLVAAEQLRLPRRAVDAALARFPILEQRRSSLAGVLSGGEQQMLAVTRALMGEPRVLLLDELATGLAPKVVQTLATTVQELAAGGMAVLLAAPELTVLGHAVDRGYVLVRGTVTATVESGFGPLQAQYEQALGIQRGGSATDPARLGERLPG